MTLIHSTPKSRRSKAFLTEPTDAQVSEAGPFVSSLRTGLRTIKTAIDYIENSLLGDAIGVLALAIIMIIIVIAAGALSV